MKNGTRVWEGSVTGGWCVMDASAKRAGDLGAGTQDKLQGYICRTNGTWRVLL